eukprot:1735301-Rhodomonas_salina.1
MPTEAELALIARLREQRARVEERGLAAARPKTARWCGTRPDGLTATCWPRATRPSPTTGAANASRA